MNERHTTLALWVTSAIIVAACIVWAVLAQIAVPDACTYDPPPKNAQYLHCE